MKRILAIAAATAAFLSVATSAIAHTHVAETNPADGSTVDNAPTEVMVRFGESFTPAQPGAITDGRLEVIDACGKPVHQGESSVDPSTSTVTVASGGAVSGRYEAHWFATAADGAEQSGAWDFTVTNGTPCKSVTRTDPAKDVDLGFDVTNITTKKVRRGDQATITLASAVKCSSFKDEDLELAVEFDTNSDSDGDRRGVVDCVAGKLKLVFTDTHSRSSIAVKQPTATKLQFVIKPHVLLGHVNLYVESLADKEECTDKVCAELAPNLGVVTLR